MSQTTLQTASPLAGGRSPSLSLQGPESSSHNVHAAPIHTQKGEHVRNKGNRGNGSSNDEGSDADEEDSNEDQDEDEDEEKEAVAPSRGKGAGKGKRPSIHVEATADPDETEDEDIPYLGAGRAAGKHVGHSKKRSYSNISAKSVLAGDASSSNEGKALGYPRKKMARRLSSSSTGLLAYESQSQPPSEGDLLDIPDNAIASSDEENVDLDDDDYAAVDLISDNEEVGPDLEEVEEKAIRDAAEELEEMYSKERRPSLDSDGSDLGLDLDDDIFGGGAYLSNSLLDGGSFFDASFARADRIASSPVPAERNGADGTAKRVRFDDHIRISDDSSSSDSDVSDSNVFPDLFLQQDRLPPSFLQMIENDADADNGDYTGASSDGEHSYWDFGGDDGHAEIPTLSEESDQENSDDAGSSGYETDTGDTTDEDLPPPPTVSSPHSLLQKQSPANSKRPSPVPFPRSKLRSKRRGPIMGTFDINPKKALALIDTTGKHLLLFPAQEPNAESHFFTESSNSSIANNSPRTSIAGLHGEDSDFSDAATPYGNAMDIMFGGMFGAGISDDALLRGQIIGPPEAFYPFKSFDANGNIMLDEDDFDPFDEDDMEDEDPENNINLDAFIDFGGSDTYDEEGGEETDVPATPAGSTAANFGSTPARPQSAAAERARHLTESMLSHFDRARGVVTSFRSNQNKYRDLARQNPHHDIHNPATTAVRSGRSAETLISPMRKRGPSMGKKRAPAGSPLVKASSNKKSGNANSNPAPAARRVGPRLGTFA